VTITSGRLLISWNAYNDLDCDTKTAINGPYLANDFGRATPHPWHDEYAELWTIDTTGHPADARTRRARAGPPGGAGRTRPHRAGDARRRGPPPVPDGHPGRNAPYRIGGLPDAARDEFGALSQAARAALADMRSVLGILRSGQPPERVPQPRVADLPELAAAARRAGVAVEVSLPADCGQVPPGVGMCAANSWYPPPRAKSPVPDFKVQAAEQGRQRVADLFLCPGDRPGRGDPQRRQRLEFARVACHHLLGGSAHKQPRLRPLPPPAAVVRRVGAPVRQPAERFSLRPGQLIPEIPVLPGRGQLHDAGKNLVLTHLTIIARGDARHCRASTSAEPRQNFATRPPPGAARC
jgi:hypothetical protein